mgnify:CR=1 FL=1
MFWTGIPVMLAIVRRIASASIALIGSAPALSTVPLLTAIVFIAGWCVVGGQPGINALAATYYPTDMRSTGIGWGLGWGRTGAIVGPLIGARLAGWEPQQIFLVFAIPAAAAAVGKKRTFSLFGGLAGQIGRQ